MFACLLLFLLMFHPLLSEAQLECLAHHCPPPPLLILSYLRQTLFLARTTCCCDHLGPEAAVAAPAESSGPAARLLPIKFEFICILTTTVRQTDTSGHSFVSLILIVVSEQIGERAELVRSITRSTSEATSSALALRVGGSTCGQHSRISMINYKQASK